MIGPNLAFGAKPSHLRAQMDPFKTNKAIEKPDMAQWAFNLDICLFEAQLRWSPSSAILATNFSHLGPKLGH